MQRADDREGRSGVMMNQLAARLLAGDLVPPRDDVRRAAVAAILHDERVLMMQRAKRDGDPWSGHISLPGGGYQADDRGLLATAIRETREELGIELAGARLLGRLAPLQPRSSGHGIEVTPFVFAVAEAPALALGPEAAGAFWLPLALVASGALDGTYEYPDSAMKFPSWTYEGNVIWGLTWRIVTDLLAKAQG
jgi:8-oxo-dGTP pyrophosphatase MutT (NUDIX family)